MNVQRLTGNDLGARIVHNQRQGHKLSWKAFDAAGAGLKVMGSTAISSTLGPYAEGGSFADFFGLTDSAMAISLIDASGHAASAASVIASIKSSYRNLLQEDRDLLASVETIDRSLCARGNRSKPRPFVSGFFGIIDRDARALQYVSCGHEAALLFHESGVLEHLSPSGPVLGDEEGEAHSVIRVPLAPGDMLVLATDGVIDAHPRGAPTDFFGMHGFVSMFRPPRGHARAEAGSVLGDVIGFSDGELDEAAVLVAQFG